MDIPLVGMCDACTWGVWSFQPETVFLLLAFFPYFEVSKKGHGRPTVQKAEPQHGYGASPRLDVLMILIMMLVFMVMLMSMSLLLLMLMLVSILVFVFVFVVVMVWV